MQTVPKRSVLRVTFNQGKPERGYDGFFARFWTGMGTGEYKATLQGFGPKSDVIHTFSSQHRPLRLALEVGLYLSHYDLALYSGLEQNFFNLTNREGPSYGYQVLRVGGGYYLPLPYIHPLIENIYLAPELRFFLGGSFQFQETFKGRDTVGIDIPLKSSGTGYGLSIGKEWYSDYSSIIYGAALSYSVDSVKSYEGDTVEKKAKIIETSTELESIGIAFNITYD